MVAVFSIAIASMDLYGSGADLYGSTIDMHGSDTNVQDSRAGVYLVGLNVWSCVPKSPVTSPLRTPRFGGFPRISHG